MVLNESGEVSPAGRLVTPSNSLGMGNVTQPTNNTLGSGDIYDNDDEKIGIMRYSDYIKWLKRWKKKQKNRLE